MFISTKIRKTTETVSELIEESLAAAQTVVVNPRETLFRFPDGSFIHMRGTSVDVSTGRWKKAGILKITNGSTNELPVVVPEEPEVIQKDVPTIGMLERILRLIGFI